MLQDYLLPSMTLNVKIYFKKSLNCYNHALTMHLKQKENAQGM